jgi:predicted transcriptional regulator
MPNVKTAISLEKPLFEQADALAREMKITRSRLFALAVKDFVFRHENRRLLARINAAIADAGPASDPDHLRSMGRLHRRLVEGQW